jgi:formylmethanofuran dehydrogenase subunit E
MNQLDQKIVARYCHLITEILSLKRVLKDKMNWEMIRTDLDSMDMVIRLKPNNPSVLEVVTDAVFNNPDYETDEVGEQYHYSQQAQTQYERQVKIAEQNETEITCTMCGEKFLPKEWRYPINNGILCEDCYLKNQLKDGESSHKYDDDDDDDDR